MSISNMHFMYDKIHFMYLVKTFSRLMCLQDIMDKMFKTHVLVGHIFWTHVPQCVASFRKQKNCTRL